MFQTHIHHWLQQFDHEYLIEFFQLITQFGGKRVFLLMLSILLFWVNIDKGFMIFQSILITILVTLGLKMAFDLPRPYHVDATVHQWDKDLTAVRLPYERKDATSFWGAHQAEAVSFFRQQDLHTWGFPSGHTSMAVVFWGSLIIFFRQKWLRFLAASMIVLVPFSRLYLGVHFLADVLAGYVLGAILLFIVYQSLFRQRPIFKKSIFIPCLGHGATADPFFDLELAGGAGPDASRLFTCCLPCTLAGSEMETLV